VDCIAVNDIKLSAILYFVQKQLVSETPQPVSSVLRPTSNFRSLLAASTFFFVIRTRSI